MQLQVNYRCDVCENMIHLDFQKSLEQKKIECTHCGVIYNFSKEDLSRFNSCYNEFVQKMKEANKQPVS
jgi:transcription elongation factor Elf1